jgi:Gpi18-like mannosyltransferase
MKTELISATIAFIATVHGFISGWAILSMDTIPFTALLVMLIYFTFINKHTVISTILMILVILMRFEGLIMLPFWYMETRGTK